jgi:hypothetical protein
MGVKDGPKPRSLGLLQYSVWDAKRAFPVFIADIFVMFCIINRKAVDNWSVLAC